MIFLLTNDDGYNSKKLRYTRDILEEFGTVYTVAPKEEQSAKGMSLTIGGFEFEKVDDFNYMIKGTPVDCVTFAYAALKIKPDIVVSGTNNGYNIGIDNRYSGTVGACLQAQYLGFPSIALSADWRGDTVLKQELRKTLKYVLDSKLYTKEYTLNINFPREQFSISKGIIDVKLNHVVYGYNPEIIGNTFKPNRKYISEKDAIEGTDTWAYLNGYTSISKIKV